MKLGLLQRLFGRNGNRETSLDNLNFETKDMIRGIVELSDTSVKEVMVPRIDVIFLSKEAPVKEMLDSIIECGHSRFPIYEGTIDNVVGILYAKDLLKYSENLENININAILRKPYFVPESKRLDTLLKEFKRRHVHIAVAVDEYGGVSGIVCMEDIIEEIVGDIQDEFDHEVEDVFKIDENIYRCEGRINIDDLNDQLAINLPTTDFDTLGGFVFDLFGKIPVKYEKVTYNSIDFIIQEMDGHKIKTIKLVIRENNRVES